jgi:hypothetical protein
MKRKKLLKTLERKKLATTNEDSKDVPNANQISDPLKQNKKQLIESKYTVGLLIFTSVVACFAIAIYFPFALPSHNRAEMNDEEGYYDPETLNYVPEFVNGRWRVGEELGSGSFGVVHYGTDIFTGDEVAIKMESNEPEDEETEDLTLEFEYGIYEKLKDGEGVPNIRWFGVVTDLDVNVNCMVLDLAGRSLGNLLNEGTFTLKTTLLLADKILTRFEFIHSRGIIHRDIKPG